ncbi:MAG: hypothetical protein Q8L01_02220 [Candidatus Woesebacteria bacterium]|nr:hypothetical protein [Candidatus Woesebacteria bacterium]
MKNFKNKKRGISILGILILIFILILVLSYFKISVKEVVESPTGQENINYVKDNTKTVWDRYLKDPATYLWNDVFMKIFWTSFINNMERIRDGKPTDYEKFAPNMSIDNQKQ